MMYTLRCRSYVEHGPQARCAQVLTCFGETEYEAGLKFKTAARALGASYVTGAYVCPVHTEVASTGKPWDGVWMPL